ncbi:hypothetical protein K503DRAFT_772679, partial [Rhizopogon vinicolor AM-OR11-026]
MIREPLRVCKGFPANTTSPFSIARAAKFNKITRRRAYDQQLRGVCDGSLLHKQA